MYVLADGVKQDPVRLWSLPYRVFFACGACHVLAYAFLKAYPRSRFAPLWIKPSKGFTGNHIVAVRDDMAFDYHGFSSWSRLLGHIEAKANRWWPAWVVRSVDLTHNGRSDLGAKVTRVRWSVASRAQVVPA